jgi:DNA-binding transcriptional regulator GbsR (MarR family)
MKTDALEKARALFIRRWGEMGATWGISRTMAEVHALLFITDQPLCTDDIMAKLMISRGSASTNLRQLLNWGLIRRAHLRGDRKEYFVSDLDAWELFETIVRERRRREVAPIIETIERCRELIAAANPHTKGEERDQAQRCDAKLGDMLDFIESINLVVNMVLAGGQEQMRQFAAALGKTESVK